MFRNISQKGQSLIEAPISIAILVGLVLGLITLIITVFTLSKKSVNETKASSLIQEGFEAVRQIRDGSWDNLANLNEEQDYYLLFDGQTHLWVLTQTPSVIDIFTRKIRVTSALRLDANDNGQIDGTDPIAFNGTLVDPNTKKITITLTWKDRSSAERTSIANSYLTNWH